MFSALRRKRRGDGLPCVAFLPRWYHTAERETSTMCFRKALRHPVFVKCSSVTTPTPFSTTVSQSSIVFTFVANFTKRWSGQGSGRPSMLLFPPNRKTRNKYKRKYVSLLSLGHVKCKDAHKRVLCFSGNRLHVLMCCRRNAFAGVETVPIFVSFSFGCFGDRSLALCVVCNSAFCRWRYFC